MKPRILASALLATFITAPVMAGTHALLPPQQGDLTPSTLLARSVAPHTAMISVTKPQSHLHVAQLPISVSWPLPHNQAVQSQPQPFARASREYWRDVSASELQKGLQLPISAPGAIIRISPGDGAVGKLDPDQIHVQLGQHSMIASLASNHLANTADMHAAGMDVPAASLMMQLKPELGSGMATLQVPAASGRYVVDVFEPNSPFTATAKADRVDLLQGHEVHVRVALDEKNHPLPLDAVGGVLRAPDGSTTPLSYQRQADGSFTVDIQPQHIPATPGLWEVHSFTSGSDGAGHTIRRDTTTVFAAAVPDARLSGLATTARASDHGIDITLGVTAQSISRYAVSAVLYGRGANGQMVPAGFAQSAAWIQTGNHQLMLHYNAACLRGISAPYELHDLRLQDQPAVGLLERRAVAMRFDKP